MTENDGTIEYFFCRLTGHLTKLLDSVIGKIDFSSYLRSLSFDHTSRPIIKIYTGRTGRYNDFRWRIASRRGQGDRGEHCFTIVNHRWISVRVRIRTTERTAKIEGQDFARWESCRVLWTEKTKRDQTNNHTMPVSNRINRSNRLPLKHNRGLGEKRYG